MNAEKKRDWVDYAALASQLYQNHQVNDIRQNLAASNQIAFLKEAREQEERSERGRLEKDRDFLFKCIRCLDRLKKSDHGDALRNFVAARQIKSSLSERKLSTASFPDFSDKERLETLKEELGEFINVCRLKFSEEDEDRLKLAEHFEAEEPALMQLIERRKRYEGVLERKAQLEKKKARWEEIKDIREEAETAEILIGSGFFAVFIGLFVAMITDFNSNKWGFSSEQLGFFIGIATFLCGCAWAGQQSDSPSTKARKAQLKERAELEKFIKSLEKETKDAEPKPPTTQLALPEQLGQEPTSEQLEMELNRRQYFADNLGANFDFGEVIPEDW